MDGLIEEKAVDLPGELQKSEAISARLSEKNKYLYRENKRLKNILDKITFEKNNLKKDINDLAVKKQQIEKKIKLMYGKIKRVHSLENENKQLRNELIKHKGRLRDFNALKAEMNQLSSKYEETKKHMDRTGEVILTERQEWIGKLKGLIRDISVDYQEIEKKFKLAGRVRHKVGKHARVGLFVDVQNMFYSAKNLYNGRLDYEKFLEITVIGRVLIQATAYIVQTPEINQTKFISLLKSMGYVVRTMDLKTGTGGFAKGNWDVGMAIDIIGMIDKIDVLVIASGDGDFVPIVKLFQKSGIRVEIVSFAYNTAIDLKEIADKFHPITEGLLIKDPSNKDSSMKNSSNGLNKN